jgi:hypothetical protein
VKLLGALALLAVLAPSRPAHAYEFWLRAHTIGQAYQLPAYSLVGPDVLLVGRRRYTQTLALRIWDIGDFARERRVARLPQGGVRIAWHSYLRVEHDFGSYANGRVATGSVRRDALDVIPELDESLVNLDLLYGFLSIEGIADDRVSLRIGRLPVDDGWGATAIDGGSLRLELPQPIAVTAAAGLRVRASSPVGLSAYELDGTAGAACREYVEGATPGTGTWKLVDRNRAVMGNRFSSDLEYCPQRDVVQPTIAVGVQTSRLRRFGAELGYRRTWSSTVGLIGDVDRLDFPDQGLYPDEFGQAPRRGVNEERLLARVHGELERHDIAFAPYAETRFSLLHAAIDRAIAGVRMTRGAHSIEPMVEYFLPTFDGDSIFNVFSIEETVDGRLQYRHDGAVRATASAWLRRYAAGGTYAGGVDAGLERALAPGWRGRVDALWDDGYGGRRVGGSAGAAWRARQDLWLRGRAIVLGVAADDSAFRREHYVTAAATFGGSWKIGDTAALHGVLEADRDAIHDTQLRALAILDLAFAPEM